MWFIPSVLFLPLLTTATPVPSGFNETFPTNGTSSTNGTNVFPINVIMLAGAAQFGLWVPRNGFWYSLSTLKCLNAGADSYGACSTPSIDQVGVVANNGPCSVVGTNGFKALLTGDPGEGLQTIAPPQQVKYITCGP